MKRAYWMTGVLCGVSFFASAQFKPTHVPENATWIAQLDAKALRKSATGALVLQLLDDGALRQIAAVQAATGLNLTNDIDTVVLFGNGNTQSNAVLSLYGRFDSARISTLLGAAKDFQNQALGNLSLLSWTDNGQQVNLCFVDPTHAVLSRDKKAATEAVKQAAAPAGAVNAALQKVLTPAPGRFLALQMNNVADFVADNQQLVILKSADALVLELMEADGSDAIEGAVMLKVGDVEQATQLQQILLGLQALLTMQAKENPEIAALAQQIKVDCKEQFVRLNVRLPQQTLKQMIDGQKAKRKPPAAANKTPPPELR